MAPLSKVGQEVVRVQLVDQSGAPVSLSVLAGGRPDPRFFNFPDGAAGVLLERTGALYRLTELPATVAPASSPGAASPRSASAGPPDAGTRPGPSILKASFSDGPITVDGVLDEAAWSTAEAQGDFRFPWGDANRGEASSIRVIWSADAVYIGARMSDKHVVAAGKEPGAIYADDMIELHLAPDGVRSQVFFLYEANLNNIVTAQFRMSGPDGTNLWFKKWDTTGVLQASRVIRGAAGDEAWIVELKFPFATFDLRRTSGDGELPRGWKAALPPVNGTTWKFNLARANRDNATGPESDYSLWSFNGHYAYGPGKDKMHFHDQNNFGTLTFVR
jgi:hypothetical protein